MMIVNVVKLSKILVVCDLRTNHNDLISNMGMFDWCVTTMSISEFWLRTSFQVDTSTHWAGSAYTYSLQVGHTLEAPDNKDLWSCRYNLKRPIYILFGVCEVISIAFRIQTNKLSNTYKDDFL